VNKDEKSIGGEEGTKHGKSKKKKLKSPKLQKKLKKFVVFF
jgi:DNA topoisomerase IB